MRCFVRLQDLKSPDRCSYLIATFVCADHPFKCLTNGIIIQDCSMAHSYRCRLALPRRCLIYHHGLLAAALMAGCQTTALRFLSFNHAMQLCKQATARTYQHTTFMRGHHTLNFRVGSVSFKSACLLLRELPDWYLPTTTSSCISRARHARDEGALRLRNFFMRAMALHQTMKALRGLAACYGGTKQTTSLHCAA